MVQMVYAAALADSVSQFGAEGVLASVEARKKPAQRSQGVDMARRVGAQSPRDVPAALSGVFGCTAWTVQDTADGFTAEARGCMLCSIAKKMDAPQPCALYCINPMKGMVEGLDPALTLTARETLWDGSRCVFAAARSQG
jgi:hypothetical protein